MAQVVIYGEIQQHIKDFVGNGIFGSKYIFPVSFIFDSIK